MLKTPHFRHPETSSISLTREGSVFKEKTTSSPVALVSSPR